MDLKESAKAIQAWEQLLAINPNAMAGDGTPVKDIIARAQKGTLLPQ
jgi:cytochrome c-type biogenesis protein CcmH/NrfG